MAIGQNQGFSYEDLIRIKIDNIQYKNLDINLRPFFLDVEPHLVPNDVFTITIAPKRRGIDRKTDIFINKNNKKFCNVSLKTGSGNSVHQENIYDFVTFLKKLGVGHTEIEALLFFHWGDTSLNGSTGQLNVATRMASQDLKNRYPDKITLINQMFANHAILILERIFLGKKDGTEPDYILYTNKIDLSNISFSNMNRVIALNNKKVVSNGVKIGNLSLQNWNRCLGGQDLIQGATKHRNDIQFKWASISNDL